ncbi:cycloartenol Synthase-like isoform X2 [Quercus lobata]|uniref:cycloartenol Synthase-like isoform X2 n=1 Tax=Quercus lobata TaxID=97700 RepID=UPI0012466D38|nr:cycloartenol Synthase-like isoform X2 [Quercus lobata]
MNGGGFSSTEKRFSESETMWKLKFSEGNDVRLESANNHIGRQYWEFDPNLGTTQEQAQVEKARDEFKKNRFQDKQSSDLLMRLQVIGLSITGALNAILPLEHRHEIHRYLYNHQMSHRSSRVKEPVIDVPSPLFQNGLDIRLKIQIDL